MKQNNIENHCQENKQTSQELALIPFFHTCSPDTYVCKHFPCEVAKISGRDCSDYKNCQTFKFRTKYPNYKMLFIGSKV